MQTNPAVEHNKKINQKVRGSSR